MSCYTTDLDRFRLALEFATMQMRCDCLLEEKETGRDRRDRLLKKAEAGRPGLQDRFLLRASDVLISFGLWLKARCQADSTAPVLRVG